jgi:hypothetical protein
MMMPVLPAMKFVPPRLECVILKEPFAIRLVQLTIVMGLINVILNAEAI